jgi:gliding motility-associated-like protein
MMKKNFLALMIICISQIHAQIINHSVINSAGGNGTYDANGNEIFYNIGEPIIATVISTTNIITQGFLQPEVAGKIGLTATAFITPTSCEDKTDGSISISTNVSSLGLLNDALSYFWSSSSACPTTNRCSSINNLAPGTYSVKVTVKGSNNFNDTVSLTNIIVLANSEPCQVKYYNGLTPNGDGLNDFFYIENIDQFKGNTVEIYSRWGQKIDEIKDYDNKDNIWKGTTGNGNEVLPSGTYFFIINLGNGTKPIKGWIELTSSK